MKIVKILIILLFTGILAVIIFIYSAFSETTWGGWTPPSTELELDVNELSWKKGIEANYNCHMDFIGLDNGYREDSILYINIHYKENSILKQELNEKIESITEEIANSFTASSKIKRKQTYIDVNYAYIHNYSNDTVKTNIPASRSCMYSLKDQKVMPTSQKLIIPKFGYFDFDPEKKDLFYYKLGDGIWSCLENASQTDSILKYYEVKRNLKFKQLDSCESYQTKFPYKIELEGGFIESHHQFIFHENHCVSVRITYNCFPGKSNLSREDFCRKVTEISPGRLKYSRKEKLNLADIFKASNYNFQGKMHGVSVHFKTDTLKNPWTITYETSLDDFKYYRIGLM